MGKGEPEELGRAREDAKRAREESKRMREEAQRLREQAHELDRRQRDREREERRNEPRGSGAPHGWSGHHREVPENGGEDPAGQGARTEEVFSLEGVRAVAIDQTAGKVFVRFCREGETPGVVTWGNKTAPNLEVQRTDDKLAIEVKLSSGWLFRRRQGQTTLVRLSHGFEDLSVNIGAGEIEIREISCSTIELDSGAGEIKAFATSGKLSASAGAGKINLQAHRGLAHCEAGAGDVLMDIAGVEPGEYRGSAGMGRVEVRLAPGHEVFIKASSGIGKSKIQYPNASDGARTRVKVASGIGEASVTTRRPADDTVPASSVGAKPHREGRAEAVRRRREAEELRVLQMLEQGKISSQEAAELIAALQGMSFNRGDDTPAEDPSDGEPVEPVKPVHPGPFA